MRFAREADGRISQRFFGAHTFRRTAFAGDYSGLEMQRTLINRAAQLHIPVLDTAYITKLLVHNGVVFGAYGFDLNDGTRYVIHADAVVLATGGHTRIWRHSSSRRDENNGDSFRLALDAGARIRDPELVQFHPSGLLGPEDAAGTLVSEAARGEGGVLRNRLGERFMIRYDPERMELSTRDRVALAAYTEIKEGRGTPKGGVWLDLSHLPRETIMRRLPRVYQTLMELQMLDVTTTPIEVAPTAHYSMGGVWVRPEDNGTGVEGLYVLVKPPVGCTARTGSAATRSSSSSSTAGSSAKRPPPTRAGSGPAALPHRRRRRTRRHRRVLAADGRENVRATQRAIRDTMTEHAGVVRDEAGLLAGLAALDEIEARIADIGVHPDIASFHDLAHAFDVKASAFAARATMEAALARRESRGCHNRADLPLPDPALQVNLVWSGPAGSNGSRCRPFPSTSCV